MNDSGYDLQDMVKVTQILESFSQGQRPPEFLSTHPDPGNGILQIQADIQNWISARGDAPLGILREP